jgi:phosphoglycolate phosphatase-like HAD superfamily hydrolase
MKNKFILFDMDGVLVDVSSSYRDTVREAAFIFFSRCRNAQMLPYPLFKLADLAYLKQSGGLNNDWDLTHRVITLLFAKVNNNKSRQREEWDVAQLANFLKSFENPMKELLGENYENRNLAFPEIDFFYRNDTGSGNIIKQIFQEVYLGVSLFKEVYGIPAEFYFKDGFILREKLFIDRDYIFALSKNNTLGIATGRPAMEALYPLKNNKIEYFDKILTLDDCLKAEEDEYRINKRKVSLGKPNPFMLDTCANWYLSDSTNFDDLYYIGDMPDDMIAAKKSKYCFKAVGVTYSSPDPALSFAQLKKAGADFIFSSVSELLEFLKK